MSVAVAEPMSEWAALLETWRELDVPEGYRAEISEGAILMSPPPGGKHNVIADVVHWVLRSHAPTGVGVFQTVAIEIDGIEKLYVPDAIAAPVAAIRDDGTVLPQDTLIAAEITSPGRANVDRQEKLQAYAQGGMPMYLLIDRVRPSGPAVTLYSDPAGGSYQHVVQVPFGESVRLPEPFDVDLDTSQFPTG